MPRSGCMRSEATSIARRTGVAVAFAVAPLALPAASAAPCLAYIGNVPVHGDAAETAIMVADLAGGAPVNVSEGLHAARAPAWSPDGGRLAFQAIADGLTDIFACRPDGTERVSATQTPEQWEESPAFVDDTHLAYLVGPDRRDVWILDLATRERRKLSDEPRFCGQPVASPDGAILAVAGSAQLAGPGDIFLLATDGSGVRNLTAAPAVYSTPCFAPDGQSMVFAFDGREIGGASRGVAAVPVAGGKPRLLASDGYPLAPPAFSSDGARIAYTSAEAYHNTWVRIMGSDGTDNVRLAVQPFHVIGWPSFSPDGRWLAYQGVYAARYSVHVVNLETGEDRAVSPEGATGVNPVFAPPFDSAQGGRREREGDPELAEGPP